MKTYKFELEEPMYHWLLMILGRAHAELQQEKFGDAQADIATLDLVNQFISQGMGRKPKARGPEIHSVDLGIVADPHDAGASVSNLLRLWMEKQEPGAESFVHPMAESDFTPKPIQAFLLWYRSRSEL